MAKCILILLATTTGVIKHHTGNVKHPTLKKLALALPGILTASRAENTTDNYCNAFERFKTWCNCFAEVSSYPADQVYISLYLISLIQAGKSASVIEGAFYAIKWYHSFLDINPCNASICRQVLEAGKRINAKPIIKKNPIKVEHIKKIYAHLNGMNGSLLNLRTIVFIVLGFCGFMRYAEISELRRSDFEFYETYVKIFIEKSKTDIYRDGHWLFLAKLNSDLCPIKLLKVYFCRCGINDDSEEFIFRGMTYFKKDDIHKLKKKDSPISYATARESVLKVLKEIGLDEKKFGLHSLRSGGATVAANNGVNDRLFKRHGRWKSDRAKDGYVEDSLKALLFVSSRLGL